MSVKCLPQKKDYKLGARKIKTTKTPLPRCSSRNASALQQHTLCWALWMFQQTYAALASVQAPAEAAGQVCVQSTRPTAVPASCRILQAQWQQHSPSRR